MGGYERASAPWALDEHMLDAIPPDFNGRLLEEDWPRFEEIAANSSRRVPVMDEVKVTRLINGPEAFTPDNEFCLGESEVRGLLRRGRLLRARARGRRRDRQGDGRVDRRGRAHERRVGDGHPALRPALPLARATRSSARKEVYETYYDIRYPGHERQAGRPLRTSSAYAWHVEHGAAFGEKSGWERVNWYESNAAGGRRVAAPARLGGDALVAGDRRRAPRHARARRAVRRVLVRQARDRRARARAEFLEALCDNRVARDVGAITYTQMLNRRGGIECDFTVTRVEEERVLDRHRHRVRQPRPELDPPPRARATGACAART